MGKSAKSGSSGSSGSLIAGILLGMVLGLAVAGGVAWYITKKNPAAFEVKEHHEAAKPETDIKTTPSPASAPAPVSASAPVAVSGVAAPKQHFEFYKVLTDKQEGVPQKNSEKSGAAKDSHTTHVAQQEKAASNKEIFYVQAGSFPNEGDAEKLKAKLALLGLEAELQTAVIPDRGTYHRVRLGPFKNNTETNKTLELLKQNGVSNATSIRVQ